MHREVTLDALLASSPEENFRKKRTGSDRIRIITEASTPCDVFVLIRFISSDFTSEISWEANALLSRKTARPNMRFRFFPFITVPVTRLRIRGSRNPTSVTASVARTIMVRSP